MTRTSIEISLVLPTGRTVRSCNTRRQLHLHGQRHFADFVEEDGAAVGDFEQAALVLVGAGEGAFEVAEEFALQQGLRKGSAVDGDEGVGGARRADVDGAGDQFFAGAAFAVDQNGAGGGGDGAHRLLELLHGAAGADDVVERVAGGGVAAQREVLLAQVEFLDRAIDGQLDFIDQPGTLANVVGGASGFHGLRRRLRSRRPR